MSGKILCQLLPSDVYNNSKKFVASQFHHHYSITVSKKSNFTKIEHLSIFLFVIFHRFRAVFPFKSLKQLSPINLNLLSKCQRGSMLNHVVIGYNRTGSNFVDILITVSSFHESCYLSILKTWTGWRLLGFSYCCSPKLKFFDCST